MEKTLNIGVVWGRREERTFLGAGLGQELGHSSTCESK